MALHSKYNPYGEAERFVDHISSSPSYIVITEPGESYTAKAFRKKFPDACLIAIRYTDNLFLSTDILWDYVYRPVNGNLAFFLLNIIPDTYFGNTLFLTWKPADITWPKNAEATWKTIHNAIEIFKSLIYTRIAFGNTWFKNMCSNMLYAQNICSVHVENQDTIFVASGSSLENAISLLQELKSPVLSSGSSYNALAFYGVPVAACISTDGGFWARSFLTSLCRSVPVFFPLESAIPKSVLQKNPLVFLSYGSELETFFFNSLKVPSIPAKRNGTVSGTAVELLLQETTKHIYTFGLDLAAGASFSHARPHKSLDALYTSTRLKNTAETISSMQRFSTNSLSIYSSWFSTLKVEKASRIFRVGLNEDASHIPTIKSLSLQECKNKYKENDTPFKLAFVPERSHAMRKSDLTDILDSFYSQIEQVNLFENIETKVLSSEQKRVQELIEFLAYSKLLVFIKERTKENESEVKNVCIQGLKKMRERL
ncbi:MAG: DUF115 domain-containing protein [Spirochaetaceae bacterium]|nr:DUF115 domain-containing protein [Spirochaetaceae bacterium]